MTRRNRHMAIRRQPPSVEAHETLASVAPRKRGRPRLDAQEAPTGEGTSFYRWRTSCGLTQQQAAELLGMGLRQIQDYDYGRSRATGVPLSPSVSVRVHMNVVASGLDVQPWPD